MANNNNNNSQDHLAAKQQSQKILTRHLASLLGFDNETDDDDGGAGDLLEHLLSIESRADLIDYLLQLLGPDRQEPIRSFVDNVERFQTGQALVMVVERPSTTADKTPNTTIIPKPDTTTQRATTPSVATVPTIPQRLAAVPPTVSPPVQQLTKATIVPISKPNSVPPKDALIMIKSSNRNKKKAASAVAAALIETRPLQGQASGKPCGCFGTLHKSLTNCLHCGRISCESEGYDYCHYCSFLVQDVEELDRSKIVDDETWKHKEELLQYDREFAQRTVVLDDQADYYSNATSAWLTDQEQAQANAMDQQRQDELQKRSKMQLNLSM